MKKLILLIVLLNTGLLFSQTVSNVAFTQRTDGSLLVDITYDLTASEAVTITVEASRDNGVTWDVTCDTFLEGGDVGEGIEENEGEEKGKSIVWNFFADTGAPGESGDNYVVKVTAEVPGPVFETGTMTGNDGTVYQTIKIGNQWWMAENSRETEYRDQTVIPVVTDNTEWGNLSTGARCSYDNDEDNADTYGYLYNWFAAVDAKNIAPAGWRVPTDADWTALETYLIDNGYNWDGATEGNKIAKSLATTSGWQSSGTEGTVGNDQSSNNASGFSALSAGYRFGSEDGFNDLRNYTGFWSTTGSSPFDAWNRLLIRTNEAVIRSSNTKKYGFSIRLVKE